MVNAKCDQNANRSSVVYLSLSRGGTHDNGDIVNQMSETRPNDHCQTKLQCNNKISTFFFFSMVNGGDYWSWNETAMYLCEDTRMGRGWAGGRGTEKWFCYFS